MAEQQPRWRFAAMTPAMISENPVQGEFFTSAADMPERLVRESIQNSMDAALGNERVRIRFTFSGKMHALSKARAKPYLNGLAPHLSAVARLLISQGGSDMGDETQTAHIAEWLLAQPLEYLVVEDSNTRGLTGDIHANGASESGNNFWGFFRQVGISTKNPGDAGSWGLGKWVFPDASRINALIAVTRREGERDTLAMGLAMLETHELEGSRYPAYGHFAAADAVDDTAWFPMPVSSQESPDFLSRVEADFQIDRGNQAGLSVIIPWPKEELTPDSIARAVITQYFLPIMRGRLEVTIQHPDEPARVVDANSIFEQLDWIGTSERDEESQQSLQGLLELAHWADTEATASGLIRIPLPSRQSNPLKDETSSVNIEELRDRYQRGDRLAFELQTKIRQKGRAVSDASCRVFLQRADEIEHGHDYFVRGDLLIPRIDHLRSQRARSLLLVEGDSQLGYLLRDAEGPAHIEWDRNAERVKERWVRGAGARIDDVRRAPLRLVQALVERPAERQFDALADLFPADIADPRGRSKPEVIPENGGDPPPLPPPPPPASPSPVRLTQIRSGFRVQASKDADVVGTKWRVQFAYELARGGKNAAFKQYERGLKDDCPDFSLYRAIKVDAHGCYSDIVAHNALIVEVHNPGFRLSVTGFDERDVLVAVEPEQSDDPDGGEDVPA